MQHVFFFMQTCYVRSHTVQDTKWHPLECNYTVVEPRFVISWRIDQIKMNGRFLFCCVFVYIRQNFSNKTIMSPLFVDQSGPISAILAWILLPGWEPYILSILTKSISPYFVNIIKVKTIFLQHWRFLQIFRLEARMQHYSYSVRSISEE